MSNVPPTEKEKLLMRMIAKLYSKNTIEEELTECINQNGRSPLVDKAAKIFKMPLDIIRHIGIQYVNYVNNNYEDVRNGIFPDEFERTSVMYFQGEETIKEIRYDYVQTQVFGLLSLTDEISKEVKDHFWEYDTDVIHSEYGDSDTLDYKFEGLNSTDDYHKNVIH